MKIKEKVRCIADATKRRLPRRWLRGQDRPPSPVHDAANASGLDEYREWLDDVCTPTHTQASSTVTESASQEPPPVRSEPEAVASVADSVAEPSERRGSDGPLERMDRDAREGNRRIRGRYGHNGFSPHPDDIVHRTSAGKVIVCHERLYMDTSRSDIEQLRDRLDDFCEQIHVGKETSQLEYLDEVHDLANALLDHADVTGNNDQHRLIRGTIEYVLTIDDAIWDTTRGGLADDLVVLRHVHKVLRITS